MRQKGAEGGGAEREVQELQQNAFLSAVDSLELDELCGENSSKEGHPSPKTMTMRNYKYDKQEERYVFQFSPIKGTFPLVGSIPQYILKVNKYFKIIFRFKYIYLS